MDGQIAFLFCCLVVYIPLITSHHLMKINDFLFSGGLEFNDLTHLINNETVTFKVPSKLNLSLENTVSSKLPEGERYSSNEFCAAEHGGTHLDAPYHFNPNGWSVGQIPFENLITPLLIVDLSTLVAGDPDFVLQRVHMDNLFHIDPKRNYTVIFRFGWSQYYGNKAKYLGAEQPTTYNLNFPGISEDVAKWLTETSRNLVGVGVDTPSVDPGSEIKGLAHQIFARHNIFMLENVKMDKTLPSNQCAIMIMPMKIQDGTGAPCRLTAICTKLSAGDLF